MDYGKFPIDESHGTDTVPQDNFKQGFNVHFLEIHRLIIPPFADHLSVYLTL